MAQLQIQGFNSGSIGFNTTLTVSQSVGASGSILFFTVAVSRNAGSAGMTATATFNGVAMTAVKSQLGTSQTAVFSFQTLNPPTGSYNAVVTLSVSSDVIIGFTSVFNNAKQSGQPDASGSVGTTMPNSASYTISTNLTAVSMDDWLLGFAMTNNVTTNDIQASSGWNMISKVSSGVITAAIMSPEIDEPTGSLTASAVITNGGYPGSFGFEIDFIGIAFVRSANSTPKSASSSIMNSASRVFTVEAGTVPMFAPVITIRQKTYPFSVITSILNYIKTSLLGNILPVLNNESSDSIYFRIYNDFDGKKNVADAINVSVTTWDGNSMTASMAVASQEWIHVQQSGFGEGSSGGALYTAFPGTDTPIGGTNIYELDNASNGAPNISEIRSASHFPGAGFAEIKSYGIPAPGNIGQLNNFVIAVSYEYSL